VPLTRHLEITTQEEDEDFELSTVSVSSSDDFEEDISMSYLEDEERQTAGGETFAQFEQRLKRRKEKLLRSRRRHNRRVRKRLTQIYSVFGGLISLFYIIVLI